jgi:putative sterol carrier protein
VGAGGPREEGTLSVDNAFGGFAGTQMTDVTADFFEALPRRGPEPLLGSARGSLRFDLTSGSRVDRWLVSIDGGDLSISRKGGKADCVVRGQKAVFDRLASGELNPLVALLRGVLTAEGDPTLLVRFQRLFPDPRRTDP